MPIGFYKPAENNAQAIIGKLYRAEGLSEKCFQGIGVALGPVLHADFAVIGLREQKGKPNRGQPAIGKSTVQVMGAQMPFQQVREI